MRNLFAGIVVIATLFLPSAISANTRETVRYATDGYALGALTMLAADAGFLADEGIDAIVQTYSYGIDTVDAVLAGNADFGVVIDFPLLTRLTSGRLMSPAIVAEPVPGWNKLYARKGLDVPSGLVGGKLGIANGTAQEFLSKTYLTDNGLVPGRDVEFLRFSSLYEIVGAMKAGRVDAAWIWDNGVDAIEGDPRWRYVADDSIVPQTTSALLVTNKAFYADQKQLVVRTLRALHKASAYLSENPMKAAQLVAKRTGGDPERIHDVIRQQRYAMTFNSRAFAGLRDKYKFLLESGTIEPYPFLDQFDASALIEAVPTADIDPVLR